MSSRRRPGTAMSGVTPLTLPAADLGDVVAGGPRRSHHGGTVGPVAHLEHGLDARLSHVQIDAFADVLDLDEVGALGAEVGEQTRQSARPVADAGEEDEPPAG